MESRQQELLKIIIKEYVKTAEPVSSGFLVEKCKLPYSSATVRNEMVKLEEAGYIFQPHTSAGRVPTAAAYQYYVEAFLKPKKVGEKEAGAIGSVVPADEASLKAAAKNLAAQTGLSVFWAFHRNSLYHTGISNLLSQPEFSEAQKMIDISKVIDQMEDIIGELFHYLDDDLKIMIGENNPFGAVCGSVVAQYESTQGRGMFGVIGPLRMDYDRVVGLVEHVKNKL